MKQMLIISRISAWVLIVCVMLFILSGIDSVRNFLIPEISSLIHLKFLLIPTLIAFTIHSSFSAHMAFKRWKIWNKISKSIIIVYILINVSLLAVFITIFYTNR
ncbi:MAG: hypothetical protein WC677_06715 [Clostridia bacterium]|jgi:hypothetical protein